MLWRKIQNEGVYFPETKAAHSMDKISNKLYLFGGWNGRHIGGAEFSGFAR